MGTKVGEGLAICIWLLTRLNHPRATRDAASTRHLRTHRRREAANTGRKNAHLVTS
jgi:hypothetical protein